MSTVVKIAADHGHQLIRSAPIPLQFLLVAPAVLQHYPSVRDALQKSVRKAGSFTSLGRYFKVFSNQFFCVF